MSKRPEVVQLIFAIGGLLLGVLVYLLDREPNTVYFVPDWLTLGSKVKPIFGFIGNYLPTFIHVYVFILLTTAVMQLHERLVIPVCITWFTIDSIFEIAQLPGIAQWIAARVPAWFQGVPFLENTASYFIAGTFDILDIVSIAAGTVCAYFTVVISFRRAEKSIALG